MEEVHDSNSMKEITKHLGVVGSTHLPGRGPCDPHCTWLETLQDMTANRCQWRSCYRFLSRSPGCMSGGKYRAVCSLQKDWAQIHLKDWYVH
ncbi:hypothetical protein T265_01550 [Opisthorchis viverrini]|uniref:Uncharacterized protein n=1 Tax=Opisthorchis viverrini TaxID=6198 RepID=A0A075A9B1_OPIVI|nr:hypothetical protein T265_01550 [Opisthorchis viverrini]KER32320.1 hypothetical protein T265_01550 [Opisthorchis viverrini]